jgi:hypothetical protein
MATSKPGAVRWHGKPFVGESVHAGRAQAGERRVYPIAPAARVGLVEPPNSRRRRPSHSAISGAASMPRAPGTEPARREH